MGYKGKQRNSISFVSPTSHKYFFNLYWKLCICYLLHLRGTITSNLYIILLIRNDNNNLYSLLACTYKRNSPYQLLEPSKTSTNTLQKSQMGGADQFSPLHQSKVNIHQNTQFLFLIKQEILIIYKVTLCNKTLLIHYWLSKLSLIVTKTILLNRAPILKNYLNSVVYVTLSTNYLIRLNITELHIYRIKFLAKIARFPIAQRTSNFTVTMQLFFKSTLKILFKYSAISIFKKI